MMLAQSTPLPGWGPGSEGQLGYGDNANRGGIISVLSDLKVYNANTHFNRW